MIYGHITAPETWNFLGPAWQTAFAWLKTVTPDTPSGIVKLQGDQIYANIHGYETLPADRCRFESHRRYADLQYCITGGEIIDWQLLSAVQPDCPYNDEKDLQFHLPAQSQCSMHMTPGSFAIFFPSDAHAPKRTDNIHSNVYKLVVKVATNLG